MELVAAGSAPSWGRYRRLYPYENFRIGRVDGATVAYIIEGKRQSGHMYLDDGVDSGYYTWILTWLQVRDDQKGQGYGRQIMAAMRDESAATATPLVWFVQPETAAGYGNDADLHRTHDWYADMGARAVFHKKWASQTELHKRERLMGFLI